MGGRELQKICGGRGCFGRRGGECDQDKIFQITSRIKSNGA